METEKTTTAPWEKAEYQTIEPAMPEAREVPAAAPEETKPTIEGAPELTEEERKQIHDFAASIDLTNTKGIVEFGSGVQKKMADFSDSVLSAVRTQDLGEVGGMLTGVISDLREFDPDEKQKGGFFGIFKKQKDKMEDVKNSYDSVSKNVEKVAESLRGQQVKLLKDVDILDKMYEANLTYFHDLTMYIAAGKEKIRTVSENELPAARAKAQASGLPEDAQKAKDLEDQLNRFEKKVHDLELTRMVAIQTAPQIRMIQNNDTVMVEKIQSTIVNTIPLWKNQMIIALGLNDSMVAAQAEAEVTDMTNELLTKNAEKLKQTTIATAKASERGIVDMETLKKTNESLISTLDEVSKIQSDGRAARRQAETELSQMEDKLKAKLLEMSQK
ncbi:MAG: toxic anion resistance protein [Lachnospiraceae bacterium]|nr:toxic anion resistance protein [Lachnospiraceae bacterium]